MLAGVCTLLVALCFWPGLSGDFILDDADNIQHNTALHLETLDLASLEQAAYSFVPRGGLRVLPELTFALDYWRGGLNPAVFKRTNLAIHVLTTLALIGFFRSLLGSLGWSRQHATLAAAAMALVWAIHPLQVSSVLYVVQRMQTLCTLFIVLALWAWLRMRLAQMDGSRSRQYGFLAVLCWMLALASKEDAALFPAYTLLLEVTILRFRAANPLLEKVLRRGYAGAFFAGLLIFLLWAVPHYWSWGAYDTRDFNSVERLLTQGRVLAMYLGQIVWPVPSHMPFFYDNFEISRKLFQPATTLPALALIAALLASAWWLRERRPLYAFGVLLFFAGHFMTSNVIGLELAFEHRNHLPLIGAVLAVTDLLIALTGRLAAHRLVLALVCMLMLSVLGVGTWARASVWGNPTLFAEQAPQLAPDSPRAWMLLCLHYHELSDNDVASPYFDKAIAACEEGGKIETSAADLSLAIRYKTQNGTVTQADWDAYLDRMEHVVLHVESRRTAWEMMSREMAGDPLDVDNVIRALEIVMRRAGYTAHEFIVIGYFLLGNEAHADDAYQYFEHAVQNLPADDSSVHDLLGELRNRGLAEWALRLDALPRMPAAGG